MSKNISIGSTIGIYKILGYSNNRSKDGHKQLHVKCVVCGLEKDIRPTGLGATHCLHKQIIKPRYCKCCGEVIPYTSKTKPANYKLRNFCSSSCAAKVNGKRSHSDESKIKASKTLSAKYNLNTEMCNTRIVAKYQLELLSKTSRKNSAKYYLDNLTEGLDYVICPYCKLRFGQIQSNHLKLHNKTLNDLYIDFGYDYKIISDKSYAKKVTASKVVQQHLVESGTHKGWQSRNIISYAEQFWIEVLTNNNILYEREFSVSVANTHYFLDFKIEHNGKLIDLEIDGKQHRYKNRVEADRIRDERLKELGYIIYRIPWNEINTENGKQEMQLKIKKFLEFYSAL